MKNQLKVVIFTLSEPSQKVKRNKDPERRHNADDDEMKFSGLNSNAEIPSKTFGILQRMSSNDDELAAIHNGKTMLNVGMYIKCFHLKQACAY